MNAHSTINAVILFATRMHALNLSQKGWDVSETNNVKVSLKHQDVLKKLVFVHLLVTMFKLVKDASHSTTVHKVKHERKLLHVHMIRHLLTIHANWLEMCLVNSVEKIVTVLKMNSAVTDTVQRKSKKAKVVPQIKLALLHWLATKKFALKFLILVRLVLEMNNALETLYAMKNPVLQSKNLVTPAKNQTNVLMDLCVLTHAES